MAQDPAALACSYPAWVDRQLAVFLSCLQYHVLNDQRSVWPVAGKERTSKKILEEAGGLANKARQHLRQAINRGAPSGGPQR